MALRSRQNVFTAVLEEDHTAICGPRYAHEPDPHHDRMGRANEARKEPRVDGTGETRQVDDAHGEGGIRQVTPSLPRHGVETVIDHTHQRHRCARPPHVRRCWMTDFAEWSRSPTTATTSTAVWPHANGRSTRSCACVTLTREGTSTSVIDLPSSPPACPVESNPAHIVRVRPRVHRAADELAALVDRDRLWRSTLSQHTAECRSDFDVRERPIGHER